ncbi:MAG: helix-turn-helix domain-containing protein [Bacteroidales bacterium]|nr:helix-turn-helix domain-containing protein [Bacteroidales bacterium]
MKVEYFPSLRHFHPEVEILLIVQGTGTRYVGDSVERYAPGDLVMIGPNVSHEWCSDKNRSNGPSEAIYILFNTEIMGSDFWNLHESKIILKIIQQSGRGIRLTGKTRDDVAFLMRRIDTSYGFTRITLLMTILEMIAFNGEYQYLATPVVQNTVNERDNERLDKVYKYVLDNCQQDINLCKAASIANLSKPAFCRYFRKRANKTFVRFLNEVRVGQACRMLVNENKSIAEICYTCGYNNISYFIRQFRAVTGFTPLGYRKKFAD